MGAGYSKRSLIDKLGIKSGWRVALIDPPRNYDATLGQLPDGVVRCTEVSEPIEFIQVFVTDQQDLRAQFDQLKAGLLPAGMLWVSWPKRSSGVVTDLDENVIRSIGLEHGLVDVKVCAVDEIWSGLKFVYRLKDR